MKNLFNILFIFGLLISLTSAWGSYDDKKRVRLQDVQVLTLHQGKMTTGQRSSPVPQLACVGGSARGMFNPQVVQCYNRGWDGVDVQWECKTDLDMDYRIGEVNVICEGYDYPEDPYILAGSCGLEYTLELTEAGKQRLREDRGGQNRYYTSNDGSQHKSYSKSYKTDFGFGGQIVSLVFIGFSGIVIYSIYKTCIESQSMENQSNSERTYSGTEGQNYPSGAGGWTYPPNEGQTGGHGTDGGHRNYGSFDQPQYNKSEEAKARSSGNENSSSSSGGFWQGAGLGGLLGYMFGSSSNSGYNRSYYNTGPYNNSWRWGNYPRWGNNWGWGNNGSWFGGNNWGWGNSGSGSWQGWGRSGTTRRSSPSAAPVQTGSGSLGTRTASGFGGTKRR
eukprot:TRINITY_DN10743_c0_g1_i3.p1 TRINITY_DN10743_c0_g1~~TRINITY_DN10743_c0_g1_i3.p1  ORF type:complete len:390 (-),score=61.00 TRINITY_DN10743_c0_g1_i3:181-1350(-)